MSIAFGKKFIFRSLALVAVLGAVSGVACAQSREYRQGYDQGYHDGVESVEHRDHGGAAGRIIIEEARYGARDAGVCNAHDAIQQIVGWRRHADIRVSNELCGDPARGREKHLHVRYRCGDSPSAEAEGPENSVIELSCR
jgi:hypothetical protein